MITTDFSHLIGNAPIKQYLKRMVEKEAIANSLLFAGPDGVGKSRFAETLAALIFSQNDPQGFHKRKIESGNHPDIFYYRPEGKLGMHSIQTLRHLSEEVYLPPYEAEKKIFIIQEADRMLSYSANALLKTFEEPPSFSVIILLSSNPSALLPTVLSRCRTVYFQALSLEEIQNYLKAVCQLSEEQARNIAALSQGSLSKAIQQIKQEEASLRNQLYQILIRGKYSTYKSLTAAIGHLVNFVEESRKQAELQAKEEISGKFIVEDLSAVQRATLEKELEGYVSMSQLHEAHNLLGMILVWYRDLHLLAVNGDVFYLLNPDYLIYFEQILQKGNLISLEKVQTVIEEAKVALQRSMSLQICLESLFLKLDFI